MKKQTRRKFAPAFKAKVALEAVKNQYSGSQTWIRQYLSLNDRFGGLRRFTIEKLDMSKDSIRTVFEPLLAKMSVNDSFAGVRALSLQTLGALKKASYKNLFIKSSGDSSYFVADIALEALSYVDSSAAVKLAIIYGLEPAKGKLAEVFFHY